MASFQKKPNGKWQYTISNLVDGKQKPIRKSNFRTKKEAKIAAEEVERKMRKGRQPQVNNISLSEYFKEWINTYKKDKVATATYIRYENNLNVIKKYFQNTPLKDINKRDYQKFIDWYGDGRSFETVSKLNKHVRSCIKDAIDEDIIDIDITRKVQIYYTEEAKKPSEKHLSFSETQLLNREIVNDIDQSFTESKVPNLGSLMVLIGITTGMRYGEIVALRRSDLDLEKGYIYVVRAWKENDKKFGDTKGKESRVIKIDQKTTDILSKYICTIDSDSNNEHKLLFESSKPNEYIYTNASANKRLRLFLNNLKLQLITFHALRHTHASLLLYKRRSLIYVSERLGHKSTVTTSNTYSHVIKELREVDNKETVKVLETLY